MKLKKSFFKKAEWICKELKRQADEIEETDISMQMI